MIVLASASPRRKYLLSLLVQEFEVLPADIDESPSINEPPAIYVKRMALEKAQAIQIILSQQSTRSTKQNTIIIAADTSVVIDNKILGKPVNLQDSLSMLRLLSGQTHQVMTSLCVLDCRSNEVTLQNIITKVTFRSITDSEIEQYWLSGEPQDKAGSYGAQGLGSIFIEHISGSFSAVIGLPMFETAQLLKQVGVIPLEEMCHE